MIDLAQLDSLGGIRTFNQNGPARGGSDTLGQADFLRLMIAQLQNQDPFKPMENGEFLGQMAQFSTVSGITELQQSVIQNSEILLGNQTLMAASLVGRSALIEADGFDHDGAGGRSGAVSLPDGVNQAIVRIRNPNGEVVREMVATRGDDGRARFDWDGLDADGQAVGPGLYTVQAQFSSGAQTEDARVLLWGRVESITFADEGAITLKLRGLGSAVLNQAREIS